MSHIRSSVLSVVGALALVAVLPSAALAQSSSPNSSSDPTASAAPAPAPVQAPGPTPYRWSGVYFGGIVAPTWAKVDVTTSTMVAPNGYFIQSSVDAINAAGEQQMKPTAVAYGGEAGYDFQVARLVFGGSFDFSVNDMNEFKTQNGSYPCCAGSSFAITQTIQTNWLMTARARVGWLASRRLLIFGTAGIAWTDLNYKAQFSDSFAAATESAEIDELVNGWIYGAGAEYRLTRNMSVKGEYLYSAFDDVSATSTNLNTTLGSYQQNVFTHTASFNLNVAKGSFKIRF